MLIKFVFGNEHFIINHICSVLIINKVYVTIHFYHSVVSYSMARWNFAQRGLVAHRTVHFCTPFKNFHSPHPFYAGKSFCPYSTPKNFYNRHSGRYAQFVSYPFRWLPVVKVSTIGTGPAHMAQLVLSSASLRVRAKDEGRKQDATWRRHLLWLLRARDSNNTTGNKPDLQHPLPRYCRLSVRHCLSTSARAFCRRLIWASPKTNRRPASPVTESEGVVSRALPPGCQQIITTFRFHQVRNQKCTDRSS